MKLKTDILIKSLTIALFLTTAQLSSAPGCMDNSRHLTELNDSKEYHFVECNCPCKTRIAKQDRCIECRHAHKPVTIEILSNAQAITPEQARRYKQYEQYLENPERIFNLRLQAMILEHNRSK